MDEEQGIYQSFLERERRQDSAIIFIMGSVTLIIIILAILIKGGILPLNKPILILMIVLPLLTMLLIGIGFMFYYTGRDI